MREQLSSAWTKKGLVSPSRWSTRLSLPGRGSRGESIGQATAALSQRGREAGAAARAARARYAALACEAGSALAGRGLSPSSRAIARASRHKVGQRTGKARSNSAAAPE